MYACPIGFDCQLESSCPSFTVDCPKGFFCSSYLDSKYLQELDDSYDLISKIYSDDPPKVDSDRAFQIQCLPGFYCPNATTILPCPSGHWCPSQTYQPNKCDFLSYCGERASFQVNFVNFLIMGIFVTITVIVSYWMNKDQKGKDKISKKKAPNSREFLDADDAVREELSEFQNSSIALTFNNIYLEHPAPNGSTKVTLPGVSGVIPAGKITGILGPTSCGKSSLLKILKNGGQALASLSADQSRDGVVDITIKNFQTGNQWKLQSFHLSANFIGYVPQEDIFDRELTVRELFTFHALIKLANSHKTYKDILIIVDEVLSELGIQHIADAIIGGDENKAANISGGQLKRVNIGCELVSLTKPSLLLLDEPTAGLDANIAYELILTLEQLCKNKGITIVVVLQQPRNEIFQRLEHLFLMNTQGGIVFEGKSSDAAGYLCSLGYSHTTDETSDADFCLDVLNGLLDVTVSPGLDDDLDDAVQLVPSAHGAQRDANQLHLLWKESVKQQLIEEDGSKSYIDQTNGTSHIIDATNSYKFELTDEQRMNSHWGSSFYYSVQKFLFHLFLNMYRILLTRTRNMQALILYFSIGVIMACGLSSGFSVYISNSYLSTLTPQADRSLQGFYVQPFGPIMPRLDVSDLGMTQLCFFMSSALGSAAALSAVPVFAGKLTIFLRERSAGINVISYGLGRILGDFYFVALNGMVFAGIWCCWGHAGYYANWMATILATSFAASGVGVIAGVVVDKNSSNVVAIIAIFVFCVFAGVEPTLAQVSRYPVVSWPWYVSFATWTAEATFYTWSKYLTNHDELNISLQDGADHFGYDVSNGLGRSIGTLIALGFAMRIIALGLLWWKTR